MKLYETLELEVVKFEARDIITASAAVPVTKPTEEATESVPVKPDVPNGGDGTQGGDGNGETGNGETGNGETGNGGTGNSETGNGETGNSETGNSGNGNSGNGNYGGNDPLDFNTMKPNRWPDGIPWPPTSKPDWWPNNTPWPFN